MASFLKLFHEADSAASLRLNEISEFLVIMEDSPLASSAIICALAPPKRTALNRNMKQIVHSII